MKSAIFCSERWNIAASCTPVLSNTSFSRPGVFPFSLGVVLVLIWLFPDLLRWRRSRRRCGWPSCTRGEVGSGFFSLVSFILSLKLLFGINEGDRDGQDCHNYSQWKPGVLGLHPCAEGDENDGKVGWNSNKDDTNWFCFDFEFHSLKVDIRRWA